MEQMNVVVGGGIAGLLAALLMAERDRKQVIVIEREKDVGGLLRYFDYGEHGRFDYGMHTMYETGITELDDLLWELLPASQWQLLDGTRRDLAGLYFAGGLQIHSPFPDLRRLSAAEWNACLVGLFRQLDTPVITQQGNAYNHIVQNFGTPIADIVIDKALHKQFGKPASELAEFALHLTSLNRVVLFGEESFTDMMSSSQLRQRIAYPEQRTLPKKWHSGRKAYYPRQYGIYHVIDALVKRLNRAGVRILTNSQVKSVIVDKDLIRSLTIDSAQGTQQISDIGQLVWTSGLSSAANALGLDLKCYTFDPPRKTVVVNILLKAAPAMGDLFYFYCYEPGCNTFRVTNFTAYCDSAPRNGCFPIAVELMLDAPLPSEGDLCAIAIRELLQMDIIASEDSVAFCAAEILASGFPMPSCRNFDALTDIRRRVNDLQLDNFLMLGVLSEANVFFQRDVLAQTYQKLTLSVPNHA